MPPIPYNKTKGHIQWEDASYIVECAEEVIKQSDAAKTPGNTAEASHARKAAIMPMLRARESLITAVWNKVYGNAKAETNPTAYILDMHRKIRSMAGSSEDKWQEHALRSLTSWTKESTKEEFITVEEAKCPPNLKLPMLGAQYDAAKDVSDRIDRRLAAESKLLGVLEKVMDFVDGQCGSPVAKYYENLRRNAGKERN